MTNLKKNPSQNIWTLLFDLNVDWFWPKKILAEQKTEKMKIKISFEMFLHTECQPTAIKMDRWVRNFSKFPNKILSKKSSWIQLSIDWKQTMYDVWNLWNSTFEKFSCTISNIYIGFSRFWGQIQWINFGFHSHFNPFIYRDVFMDSKILFSEPFILNNVFWGNFWHFVLFENMLASSEVKVSFLGVDSLLGDLRVCSGRLGGIVKVSKSQNKSMKSSFFPKNEQNIARISTLTFKAEILAIFRSFFGENDDFINLFWDLLTFSLGKKCFWDFLTFKKKLKNQCNAVD